MLVTLLANFRNKDSKTRELEFLLSPMPVRIATFVKSLGSHLNLRFTAMVTYSFHLYSAVHIISFSLSVVTQSGNKSKPLLHLWRYINAKLFWRFAVLLKYRDRVCG